MNANARSAAGDVLLDQLSSDAAMARSTADTLTQAVAALTTRFDGQIGELKVDTEKTTTQVAALVTAAKSQKARDDAAAQKVQYIVDALSSDVEKAHVTHTHQQQQVCLQPHSPTLSTFSLVLLSHSVYLLIH
jgi:hypothetical protein